MSSSNEATPVTVTILGKEFRVACPAEERESLMRSATYLDDKMRDIRARGRTVGNDNIAIMAALNIAHEMLQSKTSLDRNDKNISARIKSIQSKIESALSDARQIEI